MWLAGGGVKGGMTYGATDEFGFKAIEKPVHVHDLHATILHLLGIDHTKLTYRYSGRDFRLTDVSGRCCTTSSRNAWSGRTGRSGRSGRAGGLGIPRISSDDLTDRPAWSRPRTRTRPSVLHRP